MPNDNNGVLRIAPGSGAAPEGHGERAGDLQRLVDLDLPCPVTVALSVQKVHEIAKGLRFNAAGVISEFEPATLLSVQASSGQRTCGGPKEFHDVGMNAATHNVMTAAIGKDRADRRWLDFIQRFATDVACLDAESFEDITDPATALALYEHEAGEPFPDDPAVQLSRVVSSMATAWDGVTARLLRHAQGAPLDAGLALLVIDHRWSLSTGPVLKGRVRLYDPVTGQQSINGTLRVTDRDETREELLDDAFAKAHPDRYDQITALLDTGRAGFREDRTYDLVMTDGELLVLDARPAAGSARVALNNVITLVEAGVITREDALLRVAPTALA
ncbi:unnamed protein product, partial [Ectocarpus sp. 12 AP-2014]